MQKPQINIIATAWLMLLPALQSIAQVEIRGAVRTTQGRGVDYASVSVSPAGSPKAFLSSTFTDEDGQYVVTADCDCDSLLLKASSLDIETTTIIIPNRSGAYDIIADERALLLREVVVKSRKVYSHGDTINYNVASFLSQNDQALADVLKKMPGISVAESGQVSYQGKPIKNFYIEGLDLMKGHYGIATNNIDPNNIATVQVLENHQDIKALKGLRRRSRPQSISG